MLGWKDVLELCTFGEILINENVNQVYKRYEVVWADSALADKNCLYIIQQEDWKTVSFGEKISCIIIRTKQEEINIPNTVLNCAVIEAAMSRQLYSTLQTSFDRQEKIRNEMELLMRMVFENAGLQRMTDELSEWLDRPIAILDNTYCFIVKSKSEELDTYVEEKDREPRGITQDRLQMLLVSGILTRSANSNCAEYYEVEDFTIYYIPLYVNNVKVAGLGIPGTKKKNNNCLPVEYVYELDAIGRIFSLELAKTELFSVNGKRDLPYMFSYVLEQEPRDFNYVKNRMNLFDYNLLPNMFLMSIPFKNKKKMSVETIADSLKRVFSNSVYLIRKDEILFLISRPEGKSLSEFELKIWENQLKSYGLHAGLSSAFQSFEGIRNIFLKEAHLALNAGLKMHPDKGLFVFEEYQVDAMLAALSENENIHLFCYPALMKLKKYDEEKNADLVETLKEYLKNLKKPKEVCDALFIHKNTLYKRLTKIEQLMNCDLSDPEIIMRIQLTFHMLEMMKDK